MKMRTLAAILLMLTATAHADEARLLIQGKVIASPCVVSPDTVKKTITLPQAEARDMGEAGTGGEWVNFTLDLTNCPAYLSTVEASFSGEPDTHDATLYKNLGDAANVALQLMAESVAQGNGSTLKVNVNPDTHLATFPLSARMYTPVGDTGKGTFSAVVGVNFTYQ